MPTIGVALAIPEPWGRQLQDYRVSLGDDTAVHIPTHITLIPPVEATDDQLEAIRAHLTEAASAFRGFRVRLRGTGTFRPVSPGGLRHGGRGDLGLRAARRRTAPGAARVELQFPYHPHVTVAHHLSDGDLDRAFADLADFECVFDAASFHLYEHDAEIGWRPTTEFALAPAAALA